MTTLSIIVSPLHEHFAREWIARMKVQCQRLHIARDGRITDDGVVDRCCACGVCSECRNNEYSRD
jgi:hypothetical protein